MPIALITGPANAGKARAVLDAVGRHVAHGQEPLLIVPTRADAEHYQRELAGEAASLGVRVERFAGLVEEIVRRAGAGEPPLGTHARERVLAAVADGAGHPSSPGLVAALGELFAQLGVRRVSSARLEQALGAWRAAERLEGVDGGPALELGRMYREYCATLARLGRVDAERRAVRALDALRERPALWGRTPVLWYGFDDLTRLQLDAIETLGRVVGAPVTVSLVYEPGRVAFAGRAASVHELAPLASEHVELPARAEHYAAGSREPLAHLERSLFEPDAKRVEPGAAVRLLEGGGERAELELVAAEIAALLDAGADAGEIALLARPGGTDLDLLEEVLAAYGIPFALRRRRPFASTALGRALLGLLRSVPRESAEEDGDLGDLLAWLRAPGRASAAPRRSSEDDPELGASLADRLELAARREGLAGAAAARSLWERQGWWPLETLDRLADAQRRGPGALCEQVARELRRLFSAPWRARAPVLGAEERREAAALAAGARALGELRELARAAPALVPATALELAGTLERLELAEESEASGAVAVLDPLALRARRVRALFVCGLQEGAFPAPARGPILLGEDERRRLAETTGLRLGEPDEHSPAAQLAAERYLLYAAVSRPWERLFLSWHAATDEGEPVSRSLFVDDVCDLFAPRLYDARARRPLGALDGAPAGPGLAAGGGRRGLRQERVLAGLREHVWSPSSLERWIGCPMAWFVERMLRAGEPEPDPEPLVRGGLAHAALRDTLAGLRERAGSARLTTASLALARELLERALAEHEAEHPLSVAPERRLVARRRLRADLDRYLERAAEAGSPLEPRELELGFGFEGELAALELGDGLRLRGRIDRVDVDASGTAVVYDYKGGRAPAGARWIADGSVQVALYMRAVEQLLGLEVAGGFYQPLTGEDLRARGALDRDAGLELDCVRQDLLEHEQLRELLEQATALARRAAAEAARGELESRPQTCAFRGGCMFPSICRCER
ncbi:MAG TPA: PD-(D/E)XK nuclease family protein [Solirubrobacteraceae bacterium]|jgi:ATP-dependent helicase/DNAse subunit B|nr:PD-(D/E)XK nuclease family protein [Solirubrobacteraceae bacterium]